MADLPENERTVFASGEVDIATSDTVLAEATAALESAPQRLDIDLGAVTFIDSSGLGVLVRIKNEAGQRGTAVRLVHVPASVLRLLAISGLDQIFEVAPDA